ncbi:agmatinase [bacterium]|nr:agmatinase [bacterium]
MERAPGFQPTRFLAAVSDPSEAKAGIVGLPYDFTSSYRSGSADGPDALRRASFALETYDPMFDADLEDLELTDFGDASMEAHNPTSALQEMRTALLDLPTELPLLGFGGEHTVTQILVERASKQYPDIAYIVFDAHADLRDDYMGTPYSHACVNRRVMDQLGPSRMAMFGIRSGTAEEWRLMQQHNLLHPLNAKALNSVLKRFQGRPVYLSFDMDGFDPAEAPGTGVVEPGGYRWRELAPLLHAMRGADIVGADIVELAPAWDPTGRSEILAARLARALLLLLAP